MLRSRKNKYFIIFAIILFVLILSLCLLLSRLDTKIDLSLIRTGASSETKIYYYDFIDREKRIGAPVELRDEALFLQKSEWISLYDMNKNLQGAFIAIEDKRFYNHKGVDWPRTLKALMNYIFKFDRGGYGGSTITQQLIKNLTGDSDVSAKRKAEEIFRALNLEKELGKNEILESYLNVVYLANNCYGVGAASKIYFNKTPSDLSLCECASLAAIVQNPLKYDPFKNPENNKQRRLVVLKEMLNQNMINESEYKQASNEALVVSENVIENSRTGIYSWYTETLIDDVSTDLSKKYSIDKKTARQLILKGGMNIYSLVDPTLQSYAESIYANYMSYLKNQNGKFPQSACVILDAKTSDVLAIVGGTGKKDSNLIFNRATKAKRPPGSVLKPLSVYSVGIEENVFNYSTVYDDTPLALENNVFWPKNSPDRYRGLMPISFAVERSVNTVAVKALRDVGINKSIEYLNRFGISVNKDKDKNESSLALGQLTDGESLLNITNAYCTFANNGSLGKPRTYLYVTDNYGNVILSKESGKTDVLSPQSAYITTRLLKNVVENGTASYIDADRFVDIAGKTGTSSDNKDKWFVGYSPEYVCGVWTGYDAPTQMNYSINPSCVIFNELFSRIYKEAAKKSAFSMPYGIEEQEFCFDSGEIPSYECDMDLRGDRRQIGVYKSDNIPKNKCSRHKIVELNIADGMLAYKFTPFWKKQRAALLDYEREENDSYSVQDSDFLIKSRKNIN